MAANDVQHGGGHYKKQAIQVWDYITANGIPYLEGNVIRYISRWRDKGGLEDLFKAKHYVEKLIELETEAAKRKAEQEARDESMKGINLAGPGDAFRSKPTTKRKK